MLSICIPIYNFDVSRLVKELSDQMSKCSTPVELILIDDCSSNKYKELNDSICKEHNYIELTENIGRSKIRNLFLKSISFDFLLFLDCDSLIISNQFIQKYIDVCLNSESNVICGGRLYDSKRPNKNQRLSWKYGIKRESKTVEERMNSSHISFMSNNFVVSKSVLKALPFDERLSKYGHEDTLFGFFLKKNNIPIKHIDNPVLNGDIEDNATYLEKTNLGIENLAFIIYYLKGDKSFTSDVALLTFYNKIERYRLTKVVQVLSLILNPVFKGLLSLGVVNLTLFNFSKLSYFIKVSSKKKANP